ncbi:TIGR04222 domain-containing membrane protein [Candidatus Uabimicrobium amorphum]|uniref:TIGR04222 domain-containing membrane protein n=1 Tax=Uabimicrobium amorphum TaxID=2596890 RepID=A0A5S9IQR7_UABAM|nr:TIGR04222 domain-containing membrane protein [Candidatus Uabimicrobium amorphum]BBM85997.1 hypothetical protein UABAM_04383 [Candidatus Uabimicrobium amorphum]
MPYFFLLYILIVCCFVFVGFCFAKKQDNSKYFAPVILHELHPYEIAFFRGHEYEVANLVVFELLNEGYVSFDDEGDRCQVQKTHLELPEDKPKLQKKVYQFFEQPVEEKTFFEILHRVAFDIKSDIETYKQKFERERLVFGQGYYGKIFSTFFSIKVCVVLPVIYKFTHVGLRKTEFLVLTMVGLGVLFIVVKIEKYFKKKRLTALGEKHFKELQTLFAQQKKSSPENAEELSRVLAVFGMKYLQEIDHHHKNLFTRPVRKMDSQHPRTSQVKRNTSQNGERIEGDVEVGGG